MTLSLISLPKISTLRYFAHKNDLVSLRPKMLAWLPCLNVMKFFFLMMMHGQGQKSGQTDGLMPLVRIKLSTQCI